MIFGHEHRHDPSFQFWTQAERCSLTTAWLDFILVSRSLRLLCRLIAPVKPLPVARHGTWRDVPWPEAWRHETWRPVSILALFLVVTVYELAWSIITVIIRIILGDQIHVVLGLQVLQFLVEVLPEV